MLEPFWIRLFAIINAAPSNARLMQLRLITTTMTTQILTAYWSNFPFFSASVPSRG